MISAISSRHLEHTHSYTSLHSTHTYTSRSYALRYDEKMTLAGLRRKLSSSTINDYFDMPVLTVVAHVPTTSAERHSELYNLFPLCSMCGESGSADGNSAGVGGALWMYHKASFLGPPPNRLAYNHCCRMPRLYITIPGWQGGGKGGRRTGPEWTRWPRW